MSRRPASTALVATLTVLAVLAVNACGGSGGSPGATVPPGATTSAPPAPTAATTTIAPAQAAPTASAAPVDRDYGTATAAPTAPPAVTAAPATASPTRAPLPTATIRPTATTTPPPTAAPTPPPTSPPTPPPAGGAAKVVIQGFAFGPGDLSIAAGTTVTWTNLDSATHSVISADGGFGSSGTLGKGGSYSATFSTPGTYAYVCGIHSSMAGTIAVTP